MLTWSRVLTTTAVVALTVCFAMPAYGQTGQPSATEEDNPSGLQRRHAIVQQLENAVGTAAATADKSGVTTVAQVVPQSADVSVPGAGESPGTPPTGQHSGGTRGSSYGGGLPPTYNAGGSGGGNGPDGGRATSDGTVSCPTEFKCIYTPTGTGLIIVPNGGGGGIAPFTAAGPPVPAGPWIPTGPVTRLDPGGEART